MKKADFGVRIGIHTHNDAASPSPTPWPPSAPAPTHVQGTINGVGERCGNMDLVPLIANLQLKYHLDCLRPARCAI